MPRGSGSLRSAFLVLHISRRAHCRGSLHEAQLAVMPYVDQIMPTPRRRIRRFNPLVVALAYDGLCAFEFSCAAEVFGLPRPELEPGWYRFETCSSGARTVRGQYGLRMTVDGGLERL